MRIRSWFSRACYGSAAALTVVAFLAPTGAAQEAPGTFHSTGYATPIQVSLNTSPQTFVADLIRLDVPHGQAEFGSDGDSRARAASVFPGVGASEGPALGWGMACSQGFPCQEFFPDGGFPPPFPLIAEAENPTRPEAKPTFEGQQVGEPGSPFSFRIVDVRATATAEEATTTAVIADVNLLPVDAPGAGLGAAANPSAVHVGTLQSTTNLRIEDGAVVARAESRLSDVSLFGGAIEIEKITARSASRADAKGMLENDPEVVISGATAGGTPIKITDKGVVVADGKQDQGAIPTLSGGIGQLFGAGPASVKLIDSTENTREGTARGGAVGLSVHLEVNAAGFPSGTKLVGDLILGTASTTASAGDSGFDDDGITIDEDFDFGDDVTGGDFGGGGDLGDDFASVAGETVESDGGTEVAAPPTGGGGRTVTRFAPLEALLSGVAADRIELLYLAWTIALIGLAVSSRSRWARLAPRR